MDVECPCPERLRTGCCPDEECLGLLRSVPPERLELLVLERQAQPVRPPLALQERQELEPKLLEQQVPLELLELALLEPVLPELALQAQP